MSSDVAAMPAGGSSEPSQNRFPSPLSRPLRSAFPKVLSDKYRCFIRDMHALYDFLCLQASWGKVPAAQQRVEGGEGLGVVV